MICFLGYLKQLDSSNRVLSFAYNIIPINIVRGPKLGVSKIE
jgi:hypothetical protein